jgi:hypothetical protein
MPRQGVQNQQEPNRQIEELKETEGWGKSKMSEGRLSV